MTHSTHPSSCCIIGTTSSTQVPHALPARKGPSSTLTDRSTTHATSHDLSRRSQPSPHLSHRWHTPHTKQSHLPQDITAHVQTQALHLQLHRRVAHQSAHASSTPTPGAAHLNFMNQLLFCRLGVHPAITVAVLELGLLKTEPCWAWFEIFMPGLVSRT